VLKRAALEGWLLVTDPARAELAQAHLKSRRRFLSAPVMGTAFLLSSVSAR